MKKAEYIDPIIGTVGDEKATSLHGGGKTYPGACVPGGMVQLSPDTVTGGDNGTGYNYCHNTIEGFSFNHMSGIGWYGDLGNLQIMPIVGETDLRSGSNEEVPFENGTIGWKSEFSHSKERARAGYYCVELDRYKTVVEATASKHTGMLKISYPIAEKPGIIFNFSRRIAGHADFEHIEIIGNNTIEGNIRCSSLGGGFGRGDGNISYNLYFVFELSVNAKSKQFFSNEKMAKSGLNSFESDDAGLLVFFDDNTAEPIIVKCGISYVDLDGARNNLKAECNHFHFDKMAENAFAEWEKACEVVNIECDDETELKKFYSFLYHTLLDPRSTVDVDGRFAIGDKVFSKESYTQRTMFSGWDVYRSEFPLLSVIRPDVVNDEVNSLIRIAELKNTSFPRWELMGNDSKCMCGDPGLLVIADAFLKGIADFDVEKAYKIAIASSKQCGSLNGNEFLSLYPNCEQYNKNAYVPNELSKTLEFLLADYAMSRFSEKLGYNDAADYYLSRVKKYAENYDTELGFMEPRDENGKFLSIDNEYSEIGCMESNIFQQSWFAPYDVVGLSGLFGKERMIELLEKLFRNADFSELWNINYNHSNEPCHNITHYFNILGLAHRTQYWTRRVQNEAYRTGAFGFCGNEDVGQLSAWYVLSAMGFAQICPASNIFLVNTPLFKYAEIKLDTRWHSCKISNKLIIECDKAPKDYAYISSMKLNGTELKRSYVTYSEITNGGVLSFSLSKEPDLNFGNDLPTDLFRID